MKYGLYPSHLGPEANILVKRKIEKRLANKALYKKTKDPKYNSLQEMGKLSLNGGLYGKLNQKGSFLESPISQLKITVGCQLEILMIVEALILKGFNVTSCNTDGFDVYLDLNRKDEFFEICKYYEEKIGNSKLGNIEYTEYKEMWQLSVNDYLAIPYEGSPKKKGDFITDVELHKDPSRLIVPIALSEYIINKTPIEQFIKSNNNIYDFCLRSKANAGAYLELVYHNGKTENIGKLCRYYLTNDKDAPLLYKRGKGTVDNDLNVNQNAENELGFRRVVYFNQFFESEDYKIDYNQYIYETYKLIASMEHNNKDKDFVRKINNFNPTLF